MGVVKQKVVRQKTKAPSRRSPGVWRLFVSFCEDFFQRQGGETRQDKHRTQLKRSLPPWPFFHGRDEQRLPGIVPRKEKFKPWQQDKAIIRLAATAKKP